MYGQKKDIQRYTLADITDDLIEETVVRGKHRAQAAMEALGMRSALEIAGCWNNPPMPVDSDVIEKDADDAEVDNDGAVLANEEEVDAHLLQEIYTEQNIAADVTSLQNSGLIDDTLSNSLRLKASKMERVPTSCFPLYSLSNEMAAPIPINTPFLPVEYEHFPAI